MLRRKRKTNPLADEVEDGARAMIVEEAISIAIFNEAPFRDDFSELDAIDIGLLKTIKKLCNNLEVRNCTAKQWRQAIYQGYQVFRSLRDHRGGTVHVSLDSSQVTFEPLPQASPDA